MGCGPFFKRFDMVSTVYTAGLDGVNGFIVTVECSLTPALGENSTLDVVGLPDNAVKEAKERVKSAIDNSSLAYPYARLVVNLAPADKKKSGSALDLAIAISILQADGGIPSQATEGCCFIGELSLSGQIRSVRGVLCMVMAARAAGFRRVFVPMANGAEASVAAVSAEEAPLAAAGEAVASVAAELAQDGKQGEFKIQNSKFKIQNSKFKSSRFHSHHIN